MNAVMTVDLSELDAWSAQVQRASDDLTGIARNGARSLAQTDFGPILETMMGAYNALLPSIHQSLEDNGTTMAEHAEALRATARDFTLTEDGVVRRHQAQGLDGRDGSGSFFDVADTTIRRAGPTETSLPQIGFAFPTTPCATWCGCSPASTSVPSSPPRSAATWSAPPAKARPSAASARR